MEDGSESSHGETRAEAQSVGCPASITAFDTSHRIWALSQDKHLAHHKHNAHDGSINASSMIGLWTEQVALDFNLSRPSVVLSQCHCQDRLSYAEILPH